LDQPGRKFDMPALIRMLGLRGPDIRDLTKQMRRILIFDPDISESAMSRKLEQARAIRTAGMHLWVRDEWV